MFSSAPHTSADRWDSCRQSTRASSHTRYGCRYDAVQDHYLAGSVTSFTVTMPLCHEGRCQEPKNPPLVREGSDDGSETSRARKLKSHVAQLRLEEAVEDRQKEQRAGNDEENLRPKPVHHYAA